MIVKLVGTKMENSPYIIDKNDIQEVALDLCKELHSKMLIPTRSPALEVSTFELKNQVTGDTTPHVKMVVKGT